jgi:hypothetical protein
MKNKYIYVIVIIIIGIIFYVGTRQGRRTGTFIPETTNIQLNTILPKNADKIEIIHFHVTNQCVSCINLSKFTKALLSKINSNKIVFKEINVDLPENFKIASDYKVTDSALYFVVTKDGKELNEEDTAVWRYVLNKTDFDKYFENKLQYLLNP